MVTEIAWLVRVLGDLGISNTDLVPMFCGSQEDLCISKNSVFHEHTKYIKIDCHYVHKCFSSSLVS